MLWSACYGSLVVIPVSCNPASSYPRLTWSCSASTLYSSIQVPLWTLETLLSTESSLQELAARRWCWKGIVLCHLFFQNETISVSWHMAYSNDFFFYLIIANSFKMRFCPGDAFTSPFLDRESVSGTQAKYLFTVDELCKF